MRAVPGSRLVALVVLTSLVAWGIPLGGEGEAASLTQRPPSQSASQVGGPPARSAKPASFKPVRPPKAAPRLTPSGGVGPLGLAPVNDNFVAGSVLAPLPAAVNSSNVDATVQGGEPLPLASCATGAGRTVWYRVTPAFAGVLALTTVGSDFDTILSVYTGATLGTLTRVDCNDDAPGTGLLTSSLSVVVAPGTLYHIQVAGQNGDSGSLHLEASLAQVPANDAFVNATPLLVPNVNGSSVGATRQAGEPSPSCAPDAQASLWFRVQQQAVAGVVSASTAGSVFDTVLALYQGTTLANLQEVACNDDRPDGSLFSQLSGAVAAGSTYYLQLSGHAGATGNWALGVSSGPFAGNDNFAAAVPLTFAANANGDTTMASTEPGEPQPACHAATGATVWYSFMPGNNGGVTFTTAGSAFDTVLGLYQGATLASLVPVACNDDEPGGNGLTSRLTAAVVSGQTYHLQIGGFNGDRGVFVLNGTLGPTPPNDAFANGIVMVPPAAVGGNSVGATVEAGEAAPTCSPTAAASIWYRVTPVAPGLLDATTVGSSFDTVLTLYSGATLPTLLEVACNDDENPGVKTSRLVTNVVAGTEYHVKVAGFGGAMGAVALSVTVGANTSTPVPPTPTSTPTPTATSVVPPPIGGRAFTLLTNPGAPVQASWVDGSVETGYRGVRIDLITAVFTSFPDPIGAFGANATGFTDVAPVNLGCYFAYVLGGNPANSTTIARTDALCLFRGVAVNTAPGNFRIRLDQGNTATLNWNAPGGQTGYLMNIFPTDGSGASSQNLPAGQTEFVHNTAGKVVCFVLSVQGVVGQTDGLCAWPGIDAGL